MPRAKLTIELPEDVWVARLSRRHPAATFRVLAAIPVEDGGAGLVRITGPDPAGVADQIAGFDDVQTVDTLEASDEVAVVEFRTRSPSLLRVARDAGLPIRPPVDVEDGVATVWATGSVDRLTSFADRLEGSGMALTVERVTAEVDPTDLLTDRQREVVLAAVEHGYYDSPRRCTLGELADALGIAQSTCSETLHRAEGAIVRAFVEDLPTADPD